MLVDSLNISSMWISLWLS